jgi:putative phosphoribosyl transferase
MQNGSGFKKYFADHKDAAGRLIDALPYDIAQKKWLVVAISIPGIYYAAQIAKELKNKMDIIFIEPICAPNNKECVVGAVSETEEIVTNEPLLRSFDIDLNYIYGEANRVYDEKILSNIYNYRKGLPLANFKDKNIILVDEGCETGLSAVAAVKSVMARGAKTISYAVPIIPSSIAKDFIALVDSIYCVKEEKNFVSVDHYYENYTRLDNVQVKDYLKEYEELFIKEKKRHEQN